jgi:multidrug efflux system outer membrane protein
MTTSSSISARRGLFPSCVSGWWFALEEKGRARRKPFRSALLMLICPLLLLVSACALGPNYKRPVVNAPADFRSDEGVAQQASLADLPWWEVFKDETLGNLIRTALQNNYDLRIAVSRVEQSRQIAAQFHAQFLPTVNYSAAASDGRNEFVGTVAPNGGQTRGAFAGIASAAWEADVWGRIRRLNEAARAQYLSTEQARRGVMLSLAMLPRLISSCSNSSLSSISRDARQSRSARR